MDRRDIFEGIKTCEFRVQSIQMDTRFTRIPADKLKEIRNREFSRQFAEAIIASNKLFVTQREIERDTIYREIEIVSEARIYILNEEELIRLVANIRREAREELLGESYRNWHM